MIKLILIFIIILLLLHIFNDNKNPIEKWRDLPFIGNKDLITYNRINTTNYSRKNLPVYYPISSPLEDNYFNNINSITSPKLSMLRNVLNQVYLYINQSIEPIRFNSVNRPIEQYKVDLILIKRMAKIIIDLINKFGDPLLKVKLIKTENEISEQTSEQNRINFDIKLELEYADSENLGRDIKPDIIYIQAEYVFEKLYDDQFYSNNPLQTNTKINFKTYLLKLIVIGAAHDGFIGGRYSSKIYNNEPINM
jgi:hypothetical protein